jgi:hypothetical protein
MLHLSLQPRFKSEWFPLRNQIHCSATFLTACAVRLRSRLPFHDGSRDANPSPDVSPAAPTANSQPNVQFKDHRVLYVTWKVRDLECWYSKIDDPIALYI